MEDYKKSIKLQCSPAEVYTALTKHITEWWSDDFSDSAGQEGDEYNIAFGKTKKTFRIEEAIPNQRVSWLCLKAHIDLDSLKKRDEWVGTKIIWTIDNSGDGSILTINHQGLNPGFECYQACEPAWNYFMASIQAYLTTGTGMPYRKNSVEKEPK